MSRENKKIVSKLSHVEIVHDNPMAAAEFLEKNFGAVRVEKQWSEWLGTTFNIEIVHMMMGGVVYQILKPSELLPSWKELLEKSGPNVHNISIQVYGKDDLRERLIAAGAKEVHNWEKAIDMRAAGFSVAEEDNPIDAHFFDCTEQCGLRVEFVENCPEWEPGEQV